MIHLHQVVKGFTVTDGLAKIQVSQLVVWQNLGKVRLDSWYRICMGSPLSLQKSCSSDLFRFREGHVLPFPKPYVWIDRNGLVNEIIQQPAEQRAER